MGGWLWKLSHGWRIRWQRRPFWVDASAGYLCYLGRRGLRTLDLVGLEDVFVTDSRKGCFDVKTRSGVEWSLRTPGTWQDAQAWVEAINPFVDFTPRSGGKLSKTHSRHRVE
jgi:hypothetical protein